MDQAMLERLAQLTNAESVSSALAAYFWVKAITAAFEPFMVIGLFVLLGWGVAKLLKFLADS